MPKAPREPAAKSDLHLYPRPSLAVDPIALAFDDGLIYTLLWQRPDHKADPERLKWALPGVFVNEGEELDEAVLRALDTKVGLEAPIEIHQLHAWNRTHGEDWRGWVLTVTYLCVVPFASIAQAASRQGFDSMLATIQVDGPNPHVRDAEQRPLSLAFDHERLIAGAIQQLRRELWTSPWVLAALPRRFTLRQMQDVYEAILGERQNKDSFRRRVTKTHELVTGTGKLQTDVGHRPAELYKVTRRSSRVGD